MTHSTRGGKPHGYRDQSLPLDITQGVVLRRDSDRMDGGARVYTNVPHLFHHHSPTGFEWGYAGSGPTDLAFNITEWFLRHLGWDCAPMQTYSGDRVFRFAWRLRQEVKRRWIVSIRAEGGTIPYAELRAYFSLQIKGARIAGEDDEPMSWAGYHPQGGRR